MINYREKLFPEKYYHIFNHAVGKEILFRNDENYNFFLKKYNFYISSVADTYAYCLLPNHYHFLIKFKSYKEIIRISEEDESTLSDSSKLSENLEEQSKLLSNAFKSFFSSYSESYNKVYKRKGSLFEPRFRRKIINNKEYFLNVMNYIHMNPVYHEFVNEPDDWRYNSYTSFFNESESKLLRKNIHKYFNNNKSFVSFHDLKKSKKFAIDMELSY